MTPREPRSAKPTEFRAGGPFDVPVCGKSRRWTIDDDDEAIEDFWSHTAKGWANQRGCYVYARKNRGLTPLYVGKTMRSFGDRLFSADHYRTLDHAMNGEFGTLVVFFIGKAGRVGKAVVTELERYLVAMAKDRNPGVMNVHYATRPGFAIRSVYRSSERGSNATRQLQQTLGLGQRPIKPR